MVYTIYAGDKIHKTTHEATPNIHWIIICPRERTPFHLSVRFHLSSGGYSLPGGVVCVFSWERVFDHDFFDGWWLHLSYIMRNMTSICLRCLYYTLNIYCIQYVDRYTYIQNSTPTFKPLLFNIRIDIGFLPGYLLLHLGSNIRWKLPTDRWSVLLKGTPATSRNVSTEPGFTLLYRSKTFARSNLASEALWKGLLVARNTFKGVYFATTFGYSCSFVGRGIGFLIGRQELLSRNRRLCDFRCRVSHHWWISQLPKQPTGNNDRVNHILYQQVLITYTANPRCSVDGVE